MVNMVPLNQQIQLQWATMLSNSFQKPIHYNKKQHATETLAQLVN